MDGWVIDELIDWLIDWVLFSPTAVCRSFTLPPSLTLPLSTPPKSTTTVTLTHRCGGPCNASPPPTSTRAYSPSTPPPNGSPLRPMPTASHASEKKQGPTLWRKDWNRPRTSEGLR